MGNQGVGIDIVEISRFQEMLSRHEAWQFRQIFTQAEWEYSHSKKHPLQSLAARFAAKEACMKLFPRETSLNLLSFSDIEIAINPYGAPYLCVGSHLQSLMDIYKIAKIHISISHTPNYACAIAVAE
jgi:phosphopantetheine--protein transferase-like protein